MEKQIFDWGDFNVVDDGHYIFYNCTLKQDIGKYKKGEKWDYISINYETGELTINNDIFKLGLVIL